MLLIVIAPPPIAVGLRLFYYSFSIPFIRIFGGGLTEFTAEEKLVDEQANNRVVNQN